ncbi:MAG: sodium:solute symporter [Candidatus Marinimicrobia bacterium]|nr:sodium:solute symporter [Candidatus Neomarinimicrobiota bacterium]MDD4961636.1 sodium:solute symporter [Candidatus Neomarinimicrobiota bacterium]MDD5710322.1 sodium:solute symporter [Candidatus Neomarinimicrobiota bacterium]
MHWVDTLIIALFMIGVFTAGSFLGRSVKNMKDYFSASNNLPWWSVMVSIVAAETSVLTFLSIPGVAFLGDFSFLQVCLGYIIGRILVALIFIPMYAKGNYISVYEAVREKGGVTMQRIMSITFMATRLLADGVRLFAVAIPLSMITGLPYFHSLLILGFVTVAYTLMGGIRGVVWMDFAQWIIYMSAAIVALVIGLKMIPDLGTSVDILQSLGKLQLIHLKGSGYTLWGGIIGGAMLSLASHGTDQLIVQRILSCKNTADSKKAMIGSGIVVFIQFTFFLIIGAMLYMLFSQKMGIGDPRELLAALNLTKPDELFTKFIIENLPPAVKGITVAGIFAASMTTLSGSLSSMSSSITVDIFKPIFRHIDGDDKWLRISRITTLCWGLIMVFGAMIFTNQNSPLVEVGLSIASFTYGGTLGMFVTVRFFKKCRLWQYVVPFFFSIAVMTFIILAGWTGLFKVNWTLYTLIGVASSVLMNRLLVWIKKPETASEI